LVQGVRGRFANAEAFNLVDALVPAVSDLNEHIYTW
jgi:hypothetical protein